jgi:hypothetical protein
MYHSDIGERFGHHGTDNNESTSPLAHGMLAQAQRNGEEKENPQTRHRD